MKKLMIAVAIVCTMFAFQACGKNADNKTENNVNLTNNDVTTAQTEVTDEVPDETTSLPDRSTLEKIPDEAVDSFNQVVDDCKEIYPLAEKTKRLYVLDDETGSAEKINTEDGKTQSTESWADQVTESFAEYYQSKEVNDHLAAVVETAAVKTVR